MPSRNAVLRALGPDLQILKPALRLVELPRGRHLAEPGDPISQIYFPVRGLVTSRVIFEGAQEIELVPTGHNSAVGILAAVGFPKSLTRDLCLTETQGWLAQVGDLQKLLERSPAAAEAVRTYCYAQMAYAVRAATCNAVHSVEQRLVRWLLVASELVGRHGIRVSQEDLAGVIGAGRSIVNPMLQRLKREGLIDVGRQRIEILEHVELRRRTCECHQLLHDALHVVSADASDADPDEPRLNLWTG